MPLMYDKDKKGCSIRWGESGKKYYYDCEDEKQKKEAERKALKQASAIFASGTKNE